MKKTFKISDVITSAFARLKENGFINPTLIHLAVYGIIFLIAIIASTFIGMTTAIAGTAGAIMLIGIPLFILFTLLSPVIWFLICANQYLYDKSKKSIFSPEVNKNLFFRGWKAMGLVIVKVVLWLIPYIILILTVSLKLDLGLFSVIIFTALSWAGIVYSNIQYLNYILVPFLIVDNEDLSSREALRRSKDLMYGNRLNYFGLLIVLSLLTSAITYFCIIPISLIVGIASMIPYIGVLLASISPLLINVVTLLSITLSVQVMVEVYKTLTTTQSNA